MNRDKVIEILKKIDKYHYVLNSDINIFADDIIRLFQKTETKEDTEGCDECNGRTALIHGGFCYEPDNEPYESRVEEKAKVEEGECWVGGYKCDDCGNIQGLWHE